eukprot:gene3628-3876_t
MAQERFKVVLLGEGRVGKTSILLRYTKGEYSDKQVSTLQASYLDKKVQIGSTPVQLSIWDTAVIVIAGNKIDLEKNRNVNEQEAIQYADSVGATHFHTSAKLNKGLDEVFQSLASKMLEKKGGKDKSGAGATKQKLVIVDAPEPKKTGGCC